MYGKLSACEDRLRLLIENANDGIFIFDLHGTILELNKKALELYQRPASEVIGHDFGEYLALGPGASSEAEFKKLTVEGSTDAKNIGISRPDGSIVEVDFSSSLVKIDEDKFVFSVARDVTERNRLHQRALQSEKLAAMGTLTAGVAHEINNPLSYVLTNMELLSTCLSGLTAESFMLKKAWMEKCLSQIQEGVDRVKAITNDLKVFSRSRDTEKPTALEIDGVLESSINIASHKIRYRAKVVKNFGKVALVKAHEGRLGQVFLNLLVNAAQAIPEGKPDENEIRVSTRMVSGRVAIEIQDTGCGMNADVKERLFTPFFTTKPVGLGTGLGLSICKDIIEGFGGVISVDSQVGHGTTFQILLPITEAEGPKRPAAPEAGVSGSRKGRVLIIDDEADLAEVYGQVLSQSHDVVIKTNGREAYELLRKDNGFDVIFSDLTMPEMGGIDIYNELLRDRNGNAQKIVFMTGGVFTRKAQEFLKKISNRCLEKPIEGSQLRRIVQEIIQKGAINVKNGA